MHIMEMDARRVLDNMRALAAAAPPASKRAERVARRLKQENWGSFEGLSYYGGKEVFIELRGPDGGRIRVCVTADDIYWCKTLVKTLKNLRSE